MTVPDAGPERPGRPARAALHPLGKAWVADGAVVTGDVTLGEDATLWFGVVVRGDDAPIEIGARTNVQDGAVVHCDPGRKNVIGREVTIGHGAVLHGIRVEDHALIGMGAILLTGSVVGEGAIVGAGTVVPEGFEVPAWSLVVGVPARFVRELDEDARRADARWKAAGYVTRVAQYANGGYDGLVKA